MRVLLFCDDQYHPGQIPIDGIEPLKAKGFVIDVVRDATNFNPEQLTDYAVIVMSKCDHITSDNTNSWKSDIMQTALVDYVERGGGLLVVHSGTVAGQDTEKLDMLIGCRFAFHPNDCPVTVGALKPHPITEGVNVFCEVDEHYHIEILSNDINVLTASYAPAQGDESKYESEPYFNFPAFITPSCYVRTQGKGRVCVLTPGHTLKVWLNADFQQLLENSLFWCSGITTK